MIITLSWRKRALFLGDREIASREDYAQLSQEDHMKTYEKNIDSQTTYDADGFEMVAGGWIKFINCTDHDVYIRTSSEFLGDLIEVKHPTNKTE